MASHSRGNLDFLDVAPDPKQDERFWSLKEAIGKLLNKLPVTTFRGEQVKQTNIGQLSRHFNKDRDILPDVLRDLASDGIIEVDFLSPAPTRVIVTG